jgi:hypothetical protein
MMRGTCRISDSVRGGGSSLTWWPTTFVTRQLLVPSPTYLEIIYDFVGLTKLVACHFWVLSRTYFEILYDLVGSKILLLAIRGFCPQLLLKYYMAQQVNRVSDTKFMWATTFVTCQMLVPSPTYFEIIYDLVGSTKLVACHLWVPSPTYFEILYDLAGLKKFVACHSWVLSPTYVEIPYDPASQ